MYLSLLREEQKNLYINLAVHFASVDGDFSQEEKNMIDAYCYEMGISYDYSQKIPALIDVVEQLNAISNMHEKKMILFEIVGLAKADNNFHEDERRMIALMIERFAIKDTFVDECEHVIEDYMKLQTRINNLVMG